MFGCFDVPIRSDSAGTKDDPGYKGANPIELETVIAVVWNDDKNHGGLEEVMRRFDSVDDSPQICTIGEPPLNRRGLWTLV